MSFRRLLVSGVVALLILLAGVIALPILTLRRCTPCDECQGTGRTYGLIVGLRRNLGCGTGPVDPLRLYVRSGGTDLLECDPLLVPACFWLIVGLAVLGVGLRPPDRSNREGPSSV